MDHVKVIEIDVYISDIWMYKIMSRDKVIHMKTIKYIKQQMCAE